MGSDKEKQSYCHKVGSPKANTETEFGILTIYWESRSVEEGRSLEDWAEGKVEL